MNDAIETFLFWPVLKYVIVFSIVMVIVMAMTWIERRMLGFFQARLGPNRVGPFGLFQAIADPVKLLLKEDILPRKAEKIAYFLGPMLPIIPGLMVFTLIPYGPEPLTVTRVNVGLLLILALTSTAVYGIILGGWASNNKYSLMGGLRSAAQMVSYEVPFGLSVVGVLMMAGTLDLYEIVRYQEAHSWNFFTQIVACFVFFVAMNAESNRTPFDLPEAESELVAGFHTEYSGMKFAFFMLGEYTMMIVNSCLMVTLFMGGWTLGMFNLGLTTERLAAMGAFGAVLAALIFLTKVMFFMLVFVWFRATFPRFRFDQLMDLGWKWLIPVALANIVVTGLFILAGAEQAMGFIGIAVLALIFFFLFRSKPAKSTATPQKVIHAS